MMNLFFLYNGILITYSICIFSLLVVGHNYNLYNNKDLLRRYLLNQLQIENEPDPTVGQDTDVPLILQALFNNFEREDDEDQFLQAKRLHIGKYNSVFSSYSHIY